MFGLLLVLGAVAFHEAAGSIGKYEAQHHHEGPYAMGFLNMVWTAVFFVALATLSPAGWSIASASWPLLGIRLALEVVQAHVTVKAFIAADRSTFGFLKILTIPLLVVVDLAVGYDIGSWQLAGIGLIIFSLALLYINHGLTRKGTGLVLFSAVNAVLTISLFKYNITAFGNSVAAEQGIASAVLAGYFLIVGSLFGRKSPAAYLRQPVFLVQSVAAGLGSVLSSFAYLFAPASVITAANRSLSVLAAIIVGNAYFKEKHFLLKVVALIVAAIGITLLVR